jgi:glycosyltransferase involved in cell wall biosynthesis
VCGALEEITLDYELIVIDDASPPGSLDQLQGLVHTQQRLRLMKLSPACGLSAALTVGLATVQGDFVVTLPAGDLDSATLIPLLLDELVRADLVVGRPVRHGVRKTLHRLLRIPRWFLLGLEVRDPECLVWAARREAIAGLQLPRGMYRYLATLVAARGYRVGEVTVPTPCRSTALSDGFSNPLDLLAAWWFKHRWRQHQRVELVEANEHQLTNPCSRFNVDSPRIRAVVDAPEITPQRKSA